MHTTTSADGTTIAYDRTGSGPTLVMVCGAFSYRGYPGQVKLAEQLAPFFTVINYDRRGRMNSTDTPPYAVEHEIDDLAALIETEGGAAYVWGLSSGAILALKAAAAGLPIIKLAIQEPPCFVNPQEHRPPADFVEHTTKLIAGGDRAGAIRYFMVQGMGAPAFVPAMLRMMPGAWKRLLAVAHTLPYDAALVGEYIHGVPLGEEWASVRTPTRVLAGTESPRFLRDGARAVAGRLPEAVLVERKGLGHTKALNAREISAELVAFFRGDGKV